MFGGVETSSGVGVNGRVNGFSAVVVEDSSADFVMEVWLHVVAEKEGEESSRFEIDSSKKYGGVTVDLDDLVDNWIPRELARL